MLRGRNPGSDADHQGKPDIRELLADSCSALGSRHGPHLMGSSYNDLVFPNEAEGIDVVSRAYGLGTAFEFFVQGVFDCNGLVGERTEYGDGDVVGRALIELLQVGLLVRVIFLPFRSCTIRSSLGDR